MTLAHAAPATAAAPRLGALIPALVGGVVFMLILSENVQVGGSPNLLLQIGLTLLLPLVLPGLLTRSIKHGWPLLLLPAWAVLSYVWSLDRSNTIRYAGELAFTITAGVLIGFAVAPQRFIRLLYLATFVFCVLSVASRRTGISVEGLVLIGLTGAKNEMSFAGQMLFASGLALFVAPKERLWLRASTVAAMLLGAFIVATTRSATGILTFGVGAVVFVGLLGLERIRLQWRAFVLLAGAASLIPFLVVLPALSQLSQEFTLRVLHKDRTLTGRTYLWNVADHAIHARPLAGTGYKAFWTTGSAESIGVLRSANQTDARGFGFQDTFRELTVGLGYVGVMLFIIPCVLAILVLARRAVLRPSWSNSFFLATLLVFAARSTTDFSVEPTLIYTTLFYALFVYALVRKDDAPAAAARAADPQRSRRLQLAQNRARAEARRTTPVATVG